MASTLFSDPGIPDNPFADELHRVFCTQTALDSSSARVGDSVYGPSFARDPTSTENCLPLLIVGASLAPMILIHASELYATMIAPFAVSMVLLFGLVKMPRLTLAYGLMLYAASLGNALIYSFGPDFSLLGLQKLAYSIYGKQHQFFPICPIGTTAHVGWDENAANDLPFPPGTPPSVKGKIICIQ